MLVSAQRQPSERARSTGRRPVRALVARLLIVALLALGAAAVASWYVRDLLAQHWYVVAPAVAVVLFVALLLRRPARPAAAAAPEAASEADVVAVPVEAAELADSGVDEADRAELAAEAAEPAAVADSADLSPRALQLYVRSLEAALSEQDERLDDVRRSADLQAEEVLRRDRERVRATLDVMHATLSGQPGEVAAHRIDAALARIGVEPGVTRPLLSARPSGGLVVAFGAPPAPVAPVVRHAPAPAAEAAEAVPAPAAPVAGPAGQPLADAPVAAAAADPVADPATPDRPAAAADAPAAPQPVPPAPRRVLPVPAPPPEAAPERGRRRMRRTVGV